MKLQKVQFSGVKAAVRYIMTAVMLLACLVGYFFFLVKFGLDPQTTPRESALITVLLTIFSLVFSWVLSHYHSIIGARESAQTMIDTIAVQSTEKILNLSNLLSSLEQYLDGTIEQADSEYNIHGSINAYRHRVQGASEMVRALRQTNNTFTSDWSGVVSNRTQDQIEEMKKGQQFMQEAYAALETPLRGPREEEGLSSKLDALLQKMDKQKNALPSAVMPEPPKTPALRYEQSIDKRDGKTQAGVVFLTILRPITLATCVIRFDPSMPVAPLVQAQATKKPNGFGGAVQLSAGKSSVANCSLHLRAGDRATTLPPGEYEIRYEAKVEDGVDWDKSAP